MIGSVASYNNGPWVRDAYGTNQTRSTDQTQKTKGKSPGEELFSALDGDSSGGLSTTEFQSFIDSMSSGARGALLSAQETNSSGSTSSTTSTSSTADAESLFSQVDSDGDGSITQSELDGFMKANAPAGGPPPPGGAGSAGGTDPGADLFAAMDADRSGGVTRSELADFLAKGTSSTGDAASTTSSTSAKSTSSTDTSSLFSAIDTDGDGSVSQSELDSWMKSHRPDGPPPSPPSDTAASSGTPTSSSTSGTASTTSDASNSTDLAQMLAAAMARFAADAYGNTRTSTDLSSLFSSTASTVV